MHLKRLLPVLLFYLLIPPGLLAQNTRSEQDYIGRVTDLYWGADSMWVSFNTSFIRDAIDGSKNVKVLRLEVGGSGPTGSYRKESYYINYDQLSDWENGIGQLVSLATKRMKTNAPGSAVSYQKCAIRLGIDKGVRPQAYLSISVPDGEIPMRMKLESLSEFKQLVQKAAATLKAKK